MSARNAVVTAGRFHPPDAQSVGARPGSAPEDAAILVAARWTAPPQLTSGLGRRMMAAMTTALITCAAEITTALITVTADLRRGPSPGALSRSLSCIHGSGGVAVRSEKRPACERPSESAGAGPKNAEPHGSNVVMTADVAIEPRSYLASQPSSYRASQPTSFAATWPDLAPKQRLGRAESVTGSVRARRGASVNP